MSDGMKTILFPAPDLEASTRVFTALLGMEPAHAAAFYVGYETPGLHVGLVPQGHPGVTVPYWHVHDIGEAIEVLVDAGATISQKPQEVGGGRLVATVTDPAGNLVG